MESDRDEKVRDRAYLIWEREGRPDGRRSEHWAQAEREIDNEADARLAGAGAKVTPLDDPTRAGGSAKAADEKPARTAPGGAELRRRDSIGRG